MSAVVALLALGSRAYSTTSFVGPPPLRGIMDGSQEELHPAFSSLRSKIGDGGRSCAAPRLKIGSALLRLHDAEGLFSSSSTVSRRRSPRSSRASPTLASIRNPADDAAFEDADDDRGMSSSSSGGRRRRGAPRDAHRRSKERELFARSTSGGEPPPPQDELWSRHSVFEFKSLNDPGSNAAFYQQSCSGGGIPRSSRSQRPAADPRAAVFDDADPIPLGIDDLSSEASGANDWLRFRAKDPLGRSREAASEADGVAVRGVYGSATVELATQLGLPASATYDELRSAYRLQIKRCHPDAAGADANEFRIKALERRFGRLTASWEKFVNARQNPSSRERSPHRSSTGSSERPVSRAAAQPASSGQRRAPRKHRRRQPMDEGREILDVGGSSC